MERMVCNKFSHYSTILLFIILIRRDLTLLVNAILKYTLVLNYTSLQHCYQYHYYLNLLVATVIHLY